MSNRLALKTAFLVLGIVIGAGFASGREIVAFFGDYADYASYLVIIMGMLIYYIIYIFIRVGRYIKPKVITDITRVVFGKYSNIVNAIILLSLFVSVFAMLAGADALAADTFVDYNFPYFGIVLSFLVVIIVTGGLKSILQVNSIIVPIMVSLVIIIASAYLFTGDLGSVNLVTSTSFISVGGGVFSTLLYVCMNMLAVSIMVAEMGPIINKNNANKVAFVSSFFIVICVGLVLLGLFNSSNTIINSDMPMVRLAYSLGELFGGVYSLVILFGIFTTLLACSFEVNNWFKQFFKDKLISISVLITVAFVISRLGFAFIVEIFYPIEGMFGLMFIVGVIGYYYKNRKEIRELE